MKVCIIAFANLYVSPFLKQYSELFINNDIDFDIVIWDRHDKADTVDKCNNMYVYRSYLDDNSNYIIKFFSMYKYSCYVKNVLKNNDYDYVVVLTSLLGVYLRRFLMTYYKERYIFDVRDYSYEKYGFYKKMMKDLLENSKLNIISSVGFYEFLPKCEAAVMHNCTYKNTSSSTFEISQNATVKIGYIGVIRHPEVCRKVLEKIKNHDKIEFYFYGRGIGEDDLKKFCMENSIDNVFFKGSYEPNEKNSIIESIDVLYNAYGSSDGVKYALSNKFYDSLYYKKPLIVNDDTTMSKLSEGFSFSFDEDKSADDFIKWYESIDVSCYNQNSDLILTSVINENNSTHRKIIESIKI